ncbi:hypothetical protein OCU04_012430 [Sclerotinia nivalis]|uniref:Uncharacterized protein n=1 Tax=Sclerotinia nivalis TaxID=352851 RepID=A0A9X0DCX8_9HELO|nr:hypothetical protein OCU04_012430 [Sclerotinia nivalis]
MLHAESDGFDMSLGIGNTDLLTDRLMISIMGGRIFATTNSNSGYSSREEWFDFSYHSFHQFSTGELLSSPSWT